MFPPFEAGVGDGDALHVGRDVAEYPAVFVVREPPEGGGVIESVVVRAESLPMGRNVERFDEMDFLRNLLEELAGEDVPVTITVRLTERFVRFGLEASDVLADRRLTEGSESPAAGAPNAYFRRSGSAAGRHIRGCRCAR